MSASHLMVVFRSGTLASGTLAVCERVYWQVHMLSVMWLAKCWPRWWVLRLCCRWWWLVVLQNMDFDILWRIVVYWLDSGQSSQQQVDRGLEHSCALSLMSLFWNGHDILGFQAFSTWASNCIIRRFLDKWITDLSSYIILLHVFWSQAHVCQRKTLCKQSSKSTFTHE